MRAYATGDLMEEHPQDPRLFKVYGRADDQIALSTGEKVRGLPPSHAAGYFILTCARRRTRCRWRR